MYSCLSIGVLSCWSDSSTVRISKSSQNWYKRGGGLWSFCVSRMCHFLSNLVVCCATLKVFLFVCWLVFGFGCLPNDLDYCSSARDWDSWVSGLVCTCKASILYHRMLLGKNTRGNRLEIQFLCRLSWILEEPTEWKEKVCWNQPVRWFLRWN